ncbi:MAG: site-2 protease family protein [Candidatus Latescibacteria bacterium]|nr:site-2 protease family protein [Candidatus Latescibacterota bacterium]
MQLWRKHPSPPLVPLAAPVPITASPRPRRPHSPWIHLLLFVLTLFSTTTAGALLQGFNPFADWASLAYLRQGLPFAVTLMAILTVHEFGHYFAARHWGVKASLPYFLPLPPFPFILGTGGAVIKIRSPIPHRRALLDIGAAGPLAGFVAAVIACIAGLSQSALVDAGYFYHDPIQLGASLLFSGLSALVLPQIGADQLVLLSPVAFAGWVGLFITAFNLFPVGQLDGGHIVYALFGFKHRPIARGAFAVLLALGLYGILFFVWDRPAGWPQGWLGWLLLAFLLALFGRDHPAPYDPSVRLDSGRRRLGYLCLAIFVLCFTPVPFRF